MPNVIPASRRRNHQEKERSTMWEICAKKFNFTPNTGGSSPFVTFISAHTQTPRRGFFVSALFRAVIERLHWDCNHYFACIVVCTVI
jgi:hypothetical protein